MCRNKIFIAVIAILILGITVGKPEPSGAASSPASDCDRACLNTFVDQYLVAVVAHDPSKLPHSANMKFTENNVELKLGDGLWATADAIGTYKVYIDDPGAGQVGFYGVVEEDGHPGILGLRMKIASHKVTELETLVARRDSANSNFPNPEGLKDKPVFSEDIPADQRLSREKLVDLANGYFSTIQLNTGQLFTQFDPNCVRVENGMQTAGNPAGSGVAKQGCEEQLKSGLLRFVTRVRDRRFPVVDQQKGLVLASTFFDHAGVLRDFKLVDGTDHKVGLPFDRPFSFVMLELFKIQDGKIRQIEAVINTVPYHMPSPWVPPAQ
jgi:hypothetical protein